MSKEIALTDQQEMRLLCRYVEGDKVSVIGKDLGISDRSVFNRIAAVGLHRCRCGEIHLRKIDSRIWSKDKPHVWATDKCGVAPAGTPGVFKEIAPQRVAIHWLVAPGKGNGQTRCDVLDWDNAGWHFTFRRPA